MNVDYDLLTWEGDILRLKFWARAFDVLKQKGAVYLRDGRPARRLLGDADPGGPGRHGRRPDAPVPADATPADGLEHRGRATGDDAGEDMGETARRSSSARTAS